MKVRGITTVVAAVALALALAGCGASSAGGGEAGGGGAGQADHDATLRLQYAGVQTLDPAQNTGSTAILSNTWPVYDRLLQIAEDGKYLPMLATAWSFSADGKALTLELRKGVKFSDGTSFDARAVKANLERYKKSPSTASSVAVIDSVQVVDPQRVVLHLTKPSRAVLTSISSATGIMISRKALHSKDLGTQPVGTGAWVIDKFRPGQEVSYKLRPDTENIWDPETGRVSRVDIKVYSTDAAYAGLRSGQLDVALSQGDISALQSQVDAGQLRVRPLRNATTTAAIYMRNDRKPFDDLRVRRAVNYAIDRQGIVKALIPTTSARVQPMANVVNGFDPALEKEYPYDPAKAEQLLKEAGYPHGVNAGTMYVAEFGPFPQAAQIVQAELAKVGIKVDLEQYDVRQLLLQYPKSDHASMFDFMSYPGIEPGADLAWFLDNPLAMPGGIPKKLSARIQKIDDPTVSEATRAERAGEVIRFAMDQAYYAPVWQGVPGWVMSAKVHGVGPGQAFLGPLGGQDFRHAWVSR